jgi:dipeptidyl aminopeptidase/acylaminoacyl peptidase
MTFADLMAMKRVSDPQISPSGKWVLFSVTDVSLEKNTKVNHLWVVGLGGGGTEEQKQIPSGNDKQETKANAGILRSAQNDNQKERQATRGDGESFGRFSPDGRWVSYSAKEQIYVAAWDEAAGTVGTARQLTHVSGGADGAVWSPDSGKLMFTADVWPECSNPTHGDEAAMNGAPTWKEEDACDKAKDEAADKSPVKGQVWDALLYRHWDHYTGPKRSHVLLVSAADGAGSGEGVRDLTPASEVGDAEAPTWFLGGPQEYAWAPDSEEIAYVANLDKVPAASTNNDVFTLRLDRSAKAVKVSTSPGSDDEPEYSPDGKWLAFRSQARGGFESDKFRLMLFDREKRVIEELLPNFDRWVDEFVWAADSKDLYFTAGDSGHEPIHSVGVDGSNLNLRTYMDRFGEWGEFGELNLRGNLMVATRMTVTKPAEVFVMRLGVDSGESVDNFGYATPGYKAPLLGSLEAATPSIYKLDRLSHLNDAVLSRISMWNSNEEGVQPLEAFSYTGAEGTKVQGFILRPPGFEAGEKYPVKFLMHGGPQTAWGDAWSYRWNWELMAASGYVVIGINRRGSTGYGQKFVDEVSGDWGGRAYVDLMRGLDYAEAKFPFIDKTRECALGASYGGYMADWVLTHTNRFKCIVTHDGMYDPVAAYGSTEEIWFNEWEFRRPEDFPKGWDGFTTPPKRSLDGAPAPVGKNNPTSDQKRSDMGHPAEPWRYQALPADEDPFRKWAPLRFIQNAKTPTLVIHSQKDYRLDVSQGLELYTALQRLGVPSKMLYFPDEGHWVLKPQNSELWNEVVGDWCDRWTGSGKYAEK